MPKDNRHNYEICYCNYPNHLYNASMNNTQENKIAGVNFTQDLVALEQLGVQEAAQVATELADFDSGSHGTCPLCDGPVNSSIFRGLCRRCGHDQFA